MSLESVFGSSVDVPVVVEVEGPQHRPVRHPNSGTRCSEPSVKEIWTVEGTSRQEGTEVSERQDFQEQLP